MEGHLICCSCVYINNKFSNNTTLNILLYYNLQIVINSLLQWIKSAAKVHNHIMSALFMAQEVIDQTGLLPLQRTLKTISSLRSNKKDRVFLRETPINPSHMVLTLGPAKHRPLFPNRWLASWPTAGFVSYTACAKADWSVKHWS